MNGSSLPNSSKRSVQNDTSDNNNSNSNRTILNDASQSDFSYIVEYVFSNEPYTCIMKTPRKNSLFLSIERQSTCDQWCGEFSIQDVEDVTSSARNFKSFRKFVQMLYDGFKRTSSSVTLELLTRSQLELVCQRNEATMRRQSKGANSSEYISSHNSLTSTTKENSNKRYLDMVYHVEYDTVHYPLPLSFVEPDVGRLKKMVQTLREENARIKDDNLILQNKLKSNQENSASTDGDYEKLKREYEKNKKEYRSLKQAFEQLQKDSDKEILNVRKECESLTADYESQKNEIYNLKMHLENGPHVLYDQKEMRALKRELSKVKDDLISKQHVLKKRENELAIVQEDLLKISRSEKRWRAECDRLTKKINSLTSGSKSNTSRSSSPSRSRSPISRPNSAPHSRTSLTKQAVTKREQPKVIERKPPVPRTSSRIPSNNSSSNSVERSPLRSNRRSPRTLSSESDSKNVKKNSSRPSTPPRVWSRSPKLKAGEPKLDSQVLRHKISNLAAEKKRNTTKRTTAVPERLSRKHTTRKSSSAYSDSSSINSMSDYRTSDEEIVERPKSRRVSNGAVSRLKQKLLSSHINIYDTSDSDY